MLNIFATEIKPSYLNGNPGRYSGGVGSKRQRTPVCIPIHPPAVQHRLGVLSAACWALGVVDLS